MDEVYGEDVDPQIPMLSEARRCMPFPRIFRDEVCRDNGAVAVVSGFVTASTVPASVTGAVTTARFRVGDTPVRRCHARRLARGRPHDLSDPGSTLPWRPGVSDRVWVAPCCAPGGRRPLRPGLRWTAGGDAGCSRVAQPEAAGHSTSRPPAGPVIGPGVSLSYRMLDPCWSIPAGDVSQVHPLLHLPVLPALGVKTQPPSDGTLRIHAPPPVPAHDVGGLDRVAAMLAERLFIHNLLWFSAKGKATVKGGRRATRRGLSGLGLAQPCCSTLLAAVGAARSL
jgi:hypothetical protein